MKKSYSNKRKIVNTLLFATIIATSVVTINASQFTIDLGKTSNFAILAGSAITNTGTTIISGTAGGNIGLYPGTAYTGGSSVTLSGEVHLADTLATEAKTDLTTAYTDAAGRTPVTIIASELGGATLLPGVYASLDGTFQITGTLTLDAGQDEGAVFIFQTESSLITASNSTVKLINSAQACHTFWEVGSSATLGTNSTFVGHILAMTSITATTGAKIDGQLLTRNGAVTLDSNTITNDVCKSGGQLPDTALSVDKWLIAGIVITLIGIAGLVSKKIYK